MGFSSKIGNYTTFHNQNDGKLYIEYSESETMIQNVLNNMKQAREVNKSQGDYKILAEIPYVLYCYWLDLWRRKFREYMTVHEFMLMKASEAEYRKIRGVENI